MDSIVDALSEAYDALVAAAVGVVEARSDAGGERKAATEAALEEFQRRWELFAVACDEAEELVGSARVRFEVERLGDKDLADASTVAALRWDGLEDAIAEIKRDADV